MLFPRMFHGIKDIKIHRNITKLQTPWYFNSPLDFLPKTLLVLSLGDSFNQPVNQLPPKLTSFSARNDFDQSLDNLPQTLAYLYYK